MEVAIQPAPTSRSQDRVFVAVRIRPLSQKEVEAGASTPCVVTSGESKVLIHKEGKPGAALRSQRKQENEYAFDAAFPPTASQDEVYRGTAANHVLDVLEGINVTIMAYGATGAGKTHTMMGSTRREHPSNGASIGNTGANTAEGIIPQALVDIFAAVRARKAPCESSSASSTGEGTPSSYNISISYCEVYNEQCYDLLNPTGASLKVLEDATKGKVEVHGLSEKSVSTPEEVLNHLRVGNQNRTVSLHSGGDPDKIPLSTAAESFCFF
jgi:kinesin family protein 18/19